MSKIFATILFLVGAGTVITGITFVTSNGITDEETVDTQDTTPQTQTNDQATQTSNTNTAVTASPSITPSFKAECLEYAYVNADEDDEDDSDEDKDDDEGDNNDKVCIKLSTDPSQSGTVTGGVSPNPSGTVNPKPATVTPPATQNPGSYTMAQVGMHATSASCWSVVNGSVYDLTSWISKHPGGSSAIKSMCGQDASADFNGQHGGERRPESELAGYKIGILVN